MTRRIDLSLKLPARAHNNAARSSRRLVSMGKRARIGGVALRGPHLPPENWYEPRKEHAGNYRVVVQSPGAGYRHVVTAEDVRSRLAQLPAWMVKPLQVVQLSRMTKKKQSAPCYGMQWGNAIYLYPIEESLVESFNHPPRPAHKIEAAMFGARWEHLRGNQWKLVWSEAAIRDFYLNNVLIHELGHILDSRNTSYRDRERFAEWFALEMGYKPTRRAELARRAIAKYAK